MLTGIPTMADLPTVQNDIISIINEKILENVKSSKMNNDNNNDNCRFEIFLQKERIRATCNNHQVQDNHGIALHSAIDTIETFKKNASILETHGHSLAVIKAKCVPFTSKKMNPNNFGQLLCTGVIKTNSCCNIAICGISPEAMDFAFSDNTNAKELIYTHSKCCFFSDLRFCSNHSKGSAHWRKPLN